MGGKIYMSKLLEDVAYSLGVTAFKNGIKRAPCMDKEYLSNVVAGCKVGESIPYSKAWLKGWDEGNLHIAGMGEIKNIKRESALNERLLY